MKENENKEKIAKFLAIYALIAPEISRRVINLLSNSNSIITNILFFIYIIINISTFIAIIVAKVMAPKNKTVCICFAIYMIFLILAIILFKLIEICCSCPG